MRFAQIATRARLHHHIGLRSQEFDLCRLQLLFAATTVWISRVTCVERLQCGLPHVRLLFRRSFLTQLSCCTSKELQVEDVCDTAID